MWRQVIAFDGCIGWCTDIRNEIVRRVSIIVFTAAADVSGVDCSQRGSVGSRKKERVYTVGAAHALVPAKSFEKTCNKMVDRITVNMLLTIRGINLFILPASRPEYGKNDIGGGSAICYG